VKLISLVLHFTAILLQLVDEVSHPIHLHPFDTLPCEFNYEPCDLCRIVLSDELASDQLTRKAHYAILDGGYLVASLSLIYITIGFLYSLHQGAI
jgi:hypothetical protein